MLIEILKLIGIYVGTFVLLGCYLALIIVMLITVIYGVGYLYDSIFGNSLYKLGVYIAKKYPKIKKYKILVKIKNIIEPKKKYVRYETPLCTYCFSYTAVSLIYALLNAARVEYGWVSAFCIYILIYFVGMYRRYKENECYSLVLENNLEFLKLSFVPLTFLITIIGFTFTVAGLNLQQIDWEIFSPIIVSVKESGLIVGFANEFLLVVKCSTILLLLLYVISIPMQLVSYYIIHVIKYFRKYAEGYKKIVNFFMKVWKHFC